ncbi:MAG TPA: DUF4835 family protein [Edaphocola sp.]|nr:DUF4835 family protein [Edaphocola sp.]
MKKISLIILSLIAFVGTGWTQEFDAKITVKAERIQGVDPKLFDALQNALNQLVNNTKWTEDVYKSYEKIDCSFLLNLTGKLGNQFSGILTISASRPVFNSTYNSPLVNYMDRDISFKYEQGLTMEFDEQRVKGSDAMVANLPAIFAYYVNLILGLNYDSFGQGEGTAYFRKAQNIVINAPDEKGINGWKSSEANNKNRFYLIDQFLNPRFGAFRPYWYVYHRFGLDQMIEKPQEAQDAILEGLSGIEKLNKENPSSVLIAFFFSAKSQELINIIKSAPIEVRKKYAAQLSAIDIQNAAKYNEIK